MASVQSCCRSKCFGAALPGSNAFGSAGPARSAWPGPTADKKATTTGFELLYGVSKFASPDKQDAAAKFVNWLATADAQQLVSDKIALPINTSVTSSTDPIRQATVTAAAGGDVPVWYDLPEFNGIVGWLQTNFGGLWSGSMTPEQFAEGATIIQQGDVGDKLYLIERGRVEVSVPSPLGDRVLDTLHDGDYFGEIALLLDVPRTANVRALGPCNLLVLSKADFQRLVQRLPQVAELLSPIVQQRLAAQQAQPAAAGPA